MRDPDTLDYLFVAVISILAYLHLPWRPQIRSFLRSLVRRPHALVNGGTLDGGFLLAGVVISVTLFIVFVTKVLPHFRLAE